MRKLILLLALCAPSWAALPITFDFTAANGTALTAYSANWSMNVGTAGIYNNALISTTAGSSFLARINSETFDDDQYAQCVLKNSVNNYHLGPAVRVHASADTAYFLFIDSDELIIYRRVSGVSTVLASTIRTNSNDMVFKITAVGTVLKAYVDGVEVLSAEDSNITSGSAGVRGYNYFAPGVGQNRCDDYEAGNISAGSSAPARKRGAVMMPFGFLMRTK